MLVLSRRKNESLMIGSDIEIFVVDVRGDKARLGIVAPANISVFRKEIYNAPAAPQPREKHPPLPVTVRAAYEADLCAINDIYNHYVEQSTATYQEVAETIEARQAWFAQKLSANHPVIVAEHEGRIVGWTAVGTFRDRTAYRFTAESMVYVHPDFHGRGVGEALMRSLVHRAREVKLHTLLALIDSEQAASLALHSKLGYKRTGEMKNVGRKFDRWLNVVTMQFTLE